VTAYIAAAVKAKVTLVEKHKMGGDCLNTGCVPSKALIRSAKLLSHMAARRSSASRFVRAPNSISPTSMERVQRVIRAVAPHDSVERYSRWASRSSKAAAKIVSPWEVGSSRTGRLNANA
jgi:pyruvate/2-oxoglutarate dehydrogenase complex dihydrolipoamide dehydrogenase (E3) component